MLGSMIGLKNRLPDVGVANQFHKLAVLSASAIIKIGRGEKGKAGHFRCNLKT